MATDPTLADDSVDRDDDRDLERILTSFDSNYVWNYGSVKEGLRELYQKAKREQWDSVTQLSAVVPAKMTAGTYDVIVVNKSGAVGLLKRRLPR